MARIVLLVGVCTALTGCNQRKEQPPSRSAAASDAAATVEARTERDAPAAAVETSTGIAISAVDETQQGHESKLVESATRHVASLPDAAKASDVGLTVTLTGVELGGGKTKCRVTLVLATVPAQAVFATATGSGSVEALGAAAVGTCVDGVIADVAKKQLAKVLADRAARAAAAAAAGSSRATVASVATPPTPAQPSASVPEPMPEPAPTGTGVAVIARDLTRKGHQNRIKAAAEKAIAAVGVPEDVPGHDLVVTLEAIDQKDGQTQCKIALIVMTRGTKKILLSHNGSGAIDSEGAAAEADCIDEIVEDVSTRTLRKALDTLAR